MKKYLIAVSFFVFSCFLIAQEKGGFDDYLSNYKEIELPYDLSLDSSWVIFPESSFIPEDYILKYICESGKPCDDNPQKYTYRYGVRIKLGDYVGVVLSKYCTEFGECTTEFGIGLTRCMLIVYSTEGEQINQIVFSRISDQHFGYVTFTKNDNPCELLSVSSRLATVTDFIDDKNGILKGVLDYNIYIVDHKGKFEKKRMKSNNIKVHWGRKIKILEEWE